MSISLENRSGLEPEEDAAEVSVVRLMVPSDVQLEVTTEDFERLSFTNPALQLERSAEGALVAMPLASPDISLKCASLAAQLWLWNRRVGLGVAFDSSAGFTLHNSAIRSPDASWITLGRWEQIPRSDRQRFSRTCPDFVTEILPPDVSSAVLAEKMQEYITQGARLGWMIDPLHAKVEIYRPARPVEVLNRPETLSGEDVLPGFVLDLKGILFD